MLENGIIPHLKLRSNFRDEPFVLKDGFTITGSPVISNGATGFSGTDYLSINPRIFIKENKYSFVIDTTLPATFQTATTHILDGDGNWSLEANSGTNVITFYYDVGGVGQSIAIDATSVMNTRVFISIAVRVSGANVIADMFIGASLSTTATDAGSMTNLPTTLRIGSDTGVNFYNGTIHELFGFAGYNLTQNDHTQILDGTLFSDLEAHKSILTLPCKDSYVNGSSVRVTSALGTTITEATLGNGSTSTTFPALGNGRVFNFDGGDYINCGDHNNFSFSTTDPFSIGCLAYFNAFSTTQFFGKMSSAGSGTGEYGFWTVLGRPIFYIENNLPAYIAVDSNHTLKAFRMYFIVFTYNGTFVVNNTNFKMYIDGKELSTVSFTNTGVLYFQNTATNLVIGARNNATIPITGRVGLPFIFNSCLSPLQVKILDKQMKRWRIT